MMNRILLVYFLMFSASTHAEIPEWYKNGIVATVHTADAVILYKVKNVTLHSTFKIYNTYKIETETLAEIKGKAPKGSCYFIQVEGEWSKPSKQGTERIVILNSSDKECGFIDSGNGAPGTEEYQRFFKSLVVKAPEL
jgi:hypothetical protein